METLPEEQVLNQTFGLLNRFLGKSFNISRPTKILRYGRISVLMSAFNSVFTVYFYLIQHKLVHQRTFPRNLQLQKYGIRES